MRPKNEQFEELLKHFDNFEGDDAIIQTIKLRKLQAVFDKSITNENLMSDLFDILNARALEKGELFIQNLVAIATSRQFEAILMNGKKTIRNEMLQILQKNFQNADKFKRDDMNKFYNSIRLLGEYFNKVRLGNGEPINILGTSLLNLLNEEIEKELKSVNHFKKDQFSDVLLSQIALNGTLLKPRFKTEFEVLLTHIRQCLIEIESLTVKTKAFFLMILDLYYNNFKNTAMESSLEKLYNKYLIENGETVQKREEENVPQENGKKVAPQSSPSKAPVRVERKSESYHRNGGPRSPLKTSPPTRKSEPSHSYRYPEKKPQVPPPPPRTPTTTHKISPPQKKISPKDLRSRTRERQPVSPKAIEKGINKLNIESTKQVQNNVDENILRQQNSSETSPVNTMIKSKPQPPPISVSAANKVYFKEENSENLSWNGDASFEDDPDATIESPRVNQYSSSFLNFLSNN